MTRRPGGRGGRPTTPLDEASPQTWYAAAKNTAESHQSPPTSVNPGTKWRINLYRIDGLGADPQRPHFMCWQPTCVYVNREPNHVPEHFGTLEFR